ncbi:MAG: hypothetical protein EXR60_03670 [Dehalococcoidia bacterium]|nr:hypothetical protein [Dehalococcoidia bacterium]
MITRPRVLATVLVGVGAGVGTAPAPGRGVGLGWAAGAVAVAVLVGVDVGAAAPPQAMVRASTAMSGASRGRRLVMGSSSMIFVFYSWHGRWACGLRQRASPMATASVSTGGVLVVLKGLAGL